MLVVTDVRDPQINIVSQLIYPHINFSADMAKHGPKIAIVTGFHPRTGTEISLMTFIVSVWALKPPITFATCWINPILAIVSSGQLE